MSKITYGIIEELYTVGDERRVSYGIAAYSDGDALQIIAAVRDISPERETLRELVERCNHAELSPCQIEEVVCDFLAEI